MDSKTEEFRTYLTSIGGLYYGYNNHITTNPESLECNKGWYPLLQNLIAELVALGWDRRVTQIKEKFGGLRFYSDCTTTDDVGPNQDTMLDVIDKYEEISLKTCENCGAPGKSHRPRYWINTLCEPCAVAQEAEFAKILAK